MNVEIGTEASQFPEKSYIIGIFFAVWSIREGGTSLSIAFQITSPPARPGRTLCWTSFLGPHNSVVSTFYSFKKSFGCGRSMSEEWRDVLNSVLRKLELLL